MECKNVVCMAFGKCTMPEVFKKAGNCSFATQVQESGKQLCRECFGHGCGKCNNNGYVEGVAVCR